MPSPEAAGFRRDLDHVRVVAISTALIGPTIAAAVVPPLVIKSAGVAAPFAFLVGFVAMSVVGASFAMFARRRATAGSVITFVADTFGVPWGFAAGWALLSTYVAFAAGASSVVAENVLLLVPKALPGWAWIPLTIVTLVSAASLAVLRVKVAATMLLALECASMLAVLVVATAAIGQQPAIPAIAQPSAGDIGNGVLFVVLALGGFEAAATLGREAVRPHTAIPWAIQGSLVIAGLFLFALCYAEVVGFGVFQLSALASAESPLQTLAVRFVGAGFGKLLEGMIALSAFSMVLAAFFAASRLVFTLSLVTGAEQLAVLDQTNAAPARATGLVLAIAVASVVLESGRPSAVSFNSDVLTIGGLPLVVAYLAVAVAATVDAARREAWWFCGCGVVGSAILLWPLWSQIYPLPGWPTIIFPSIAIAWLLVGGVLGLILGRRHGESAAHTGEADVRLSQLEP